MLVVPLAVGTVVQQPESTRPPGRRGCGRADAEETGEEASLSAIQSLLDPLTLEVALQSGGSTQLQGELEALSTLRMLHSAEQNATFRNYR